MRDAQARHRGVTHHIAIVHPQTYLRSHQNGAIGAGKAPIGDTAIGIEDAFVPFEFAQRHRRAVAGKIIGAGD